MHFKDRIGRMIENEGVNSNKLSKILGYPRSQTLYNITDGKVLPSFDFFYRLFSTKEFDKYDPIWLITGKGNMLKNEISDKENDKKGIIFKEPKSEYLTNIIKEKDKRIEDLLGQIEFLKKMIEEKI